nr:hypothetical protein HK105_006825 [Polyrhizophydium stewartii]
MAGEPDMGGPAPGFGHFGSFSSSQPKRSLATSPFGLPDVAKLDKLSDPAFFPPKPAPLMSSYSSPDLSAFRIKSAFADFGDAPTEAHMFVQMTGALPSSGAIDSGAAAALPGTYGICRYYLQGYCSRGDRCNFAHIMNMSALSSIHAHQPAVQSQNQMALQNQAALNLAAVAAASSLSIHPHAAATFYNPNSLSAAAAAAAVANAPLLYPGLPYSHQVAAALHLSGVPGFNPFKFHAAMQRQKKHSQEEASRFSNVSLDDLVGQIAILSKDQHGCRFLQRKLEEQNEKNLNIIFGEVFAHFSELMIDPFGNYLCQKLLEFCTEEQRTLLVENVSHDLISISLNMHGTRAVQKLIELVNTPHQISSVISALGVNVVALIKDLNGNHVRCIDHASDAQRAQLVGDITFHALTLVQDPFGNYVVQYVLDLPEKHYSEAVVNRFLEHVCLLSVQKFSSNCIRVSSPETRALLIGELLSKDRLDRLLRDSYANYVIQTALDYADTPQRMQLVECIRPILPSIRNTPYGKRIQTKIMRDQFGPPPSATVSIRSPCCKKWFDCPECHQEASDHELKRTTEMVFACKKCKKVFRKDLREYDETDEYCPHCDNHYVIEAKTPQMAVGVEGDDPRLLRDMRAKQMQLLEEDLMADRLG